MKFTKSLLILFILSYILNAGIVGSTKGEFNVNKGVATYKIDIETPPGIAGMDAKLSVNYYSSFKNGLLGYGWSIGGLSTISRCSQTKLIDGESHKFGVKLDGNDRFCLDGQRLIVVHGSYGKNGSEYRKQLNDYSKIIAHSNGNGVDYFEVKTKDGLTYIYGKDDSALVKNSKKLFWKLKEIRDTYGNKITYFYNVNNSSGEHYIKSIKYADNSIEFVYENRDDKDTKYVYGNKLTRDKRLKEIVVKANSKVAHKYIFDYKYSSSGYSIVSKITEYVNNSGSLVALKPLYINYQDGEYKFTNSLEFNINDKDGKYYFVDLNLDGYKDIVKIDGNDKQYISIYKGSNSGKFKFEKRIKLATGGGSKETDYLENLQFADFNGDGFLDLLYIEKMRIGYDRTNQRYISAFAPYIRYSLGTFDYSGKDNMFLRNTMNKIFNKIQNGSYVKYTYRIGDFNKDGYSDILLYSDVDGKKIEIAYGKSNKTFTEKTVMTNPPADPQNLKVADFNGDGLPDLYFVQDGADSIYINNGSGHYEKKFSPKVYAKTEDVYLIDLNNDGATDLYEVDDGDENIWINDGKGNLKLTYHPDIHADSKNLKFADFNGDGYIDVLDVNGEDDADVIWLNNKNGNFLKSKSIGIYEESKYITVSDVNGDGFADIIDLHSQDIFKNNAKHLLADRFYNETNEDVKVAYGLMNDSSVLYNYNLHNEKETFNNLAYKNIELSLAQPIVYKVSTLNGLQSYNSLKYRYYGYVINKDYGSQGFHAIYTTDETTGLLSGEFYKIIDGANGHNHQYSGMPYFSFSGRKLGARWRHWQTDRAITYADASKVKNVYEVYTKSNIQTIYDPKYYTKLKQITHINKLSSDGHGNILSTQDIVEDFIHNKKYTKVTYNKYNDNDSKWYLGRLIETKIKHEATGAKAISKMVQFAYNDKGILDKEIANAGTQYALTKTYKYDSHGNKVQEEITAKDIESAKTTYKYDSSGKFLISTTTPDGLTTHYKHEPIYGKVSEVTDPNGLTTKFVYDGLGRKIKQIYPDGTYTEWGHTWANSWIGAKNVLYTVSTYTPGKPFKRVYYDRLGREVGSYTYTMKKGKRKSYYSRRILQRKYYNAKGLLIKEELPHYQNSSSYGVIYKKYDDFGRLVELRKPGANSKEQVFKTYYRNLYSIVTDAKGIKKYVEKDARGKTVKIVDGYSSSMASTINYYYDATGNLTKTVDAKGNITTIAYNSAGFKYYMKDPDLGVWRYYYNALGELIKEYDSAHKNYHSIYYDVAGRVIKEYFADITKTGRDRSYNYRTYYYGTKSAKAGSRGKLLVAYASSKQDGRDWHGEKEYYRYDRYGRLIQSKKHIYGVDDYITKTTYDKYNRVSSISYPNGYRVYYHYNAGILDYVKDSKHKTLYTINEYDAFGKIASSIYGNGIKHQALSNKAGFVETILDYSNITNKGTLQRVDYLYDSMNNITQRTFTLQKDDYIEDNYKYDSLNRLTSTKTSTNLIGFDKSLTLRYDLLGNITYKSDMGSYSYRDSNHKHAVTSAGSHKYRYDSIGNMVYRDGDTISYYPLGKVATLKNKSKEVDYYYGIGGKRYLKRDDKFDTVYVGKIYEERLDKGGDGRRREISYIYAGNMLIGTHEETLSPYIDGKTNKPIKEDIIL